MAAIREANIEHSLGVPPQVFDEMNQKIEKIENFVTVTLPHLPALLESGGPSVLKLIFDDIKGLIDSLDYRKLPVKKQNVLLMDLLFIESMLLNTKQEVVMELSQLIEQLAQFLQRPAVLTFEDLIFLNLQCEVPRTFSAGAVRKSELAFYQMNHDVDKKCALGIEAIKTAMEALQIPGPAGITLAEAKISAVADPFSEIGAIMQNGSKALPREDFAKFRGYLTTHPVRNLKGPSGAFSGNVPLFELLLSGDKLPSEYVNYLIENLQYFPRNTQAQLKKFIEAEKMPTSLMSLAEGISGTENLQEMLKKLGAGLKAFRAKHYAAVKHHIPEVISGAVAGTAGEADVSAFLRARINMTIT